MVLNAVDVYRQASKIRELLPEKYPNAAIVEGILEGKISGKVWASSDSDAYLLTTNSPFNFVIGNISNRFIKQAMSVIPKKDCSFVVYCNDSKYFLENAYPTKARLHFACDSHDIVELPVKITGRITRQYQSNLIDEVLFEKCNWKDRLLEFYTTNVNFLQLGYGMVMLNKQKIVSEVYGIVGGHYSEWGAFTDPQYRGFGLVPFGMSTLVKHYCISNGLAVAASCSIDNTASEKTIGAIGMKKDFEYFVLDISRMQNIEVGSLQDKHLCELQSE